jgi:DnaJ-class molecular chaperone
MGKRVEKVYEKETCNACGGSGQHSNRYSEEYRDCVSDCSYCNGDGYNIIEKWEEVDE